MFQYIKTHPVASFFILTYLGSWLGWAPWWLSQSGIGLLPYELPFAAIAGINQIGLWAGPFLAAFLVTRIVDGEEGVRHLKQRIFQWRVRPAVYFATLIGLPVIFVGSYFLFFGATISPEFSSASIATIVITLFLYLAGGPIQEEPGWRGFALPRLQKAYHPLVAAVIIGIVHCFWHAPLFFTSEWDTARGDVTQFLAYFILILSMSVILSWLVNVSKGSSFVAIIGHNAVNWSLFIVATVTATTVTNNWPIALALGAVAIVIIAASKARLGYRAYRGTPSIAREES